MIFGLGSRPRQGRLEADEQMAMGAASLIPWAKAQQLYQLLKPPPTHAARQFERIKAVERDILLPVRAGFVIMLAYGLFFSPWIHSVVLMRDVILEFIQKFFVAYAASNLLVAYALLAVRRFSLSALRWVLFISGLLDGLLLALLVLLTNGFESLLYWFFPVLIVRNAVSLPLAGQQISLNFLISLLYLLAGLLHMSLTESELASAAREQIRLDHLGMVATNMLPPSLDPSVRASLGLGAADYPAEPFIMRVTVLFLLALICYGLQILFEKERIAAEEAREVAARQGQLDAAGRLSGEIAHQLKNPLGIINNAAFNLQRLLAADKPVVRAQVDMIREEVGRADGIITELMGYAKLADGRVEKLDVAGELDRALAVVFPPAAHYPVAILREYQAGLPPLMMQRGHLADIFVNILQNAREAMGGQGRLRVSATAEGEAEIEVTIADSGPGIPPERLEQVFQAYYTTKEKGSGLGLAIVRRSLDIYGGKARVESELGKGARFILNLPARTFAK
jgi:signal transduction histidine kinase